MVWENNRVRDRPHNVVNPANFLDWRDQAKSFDEMAAFVDQRYNLTGAGEPEEVPSQLATPNLFTLLGSPAALGRTFTPEDAAAGREDVAVLSHGLWQRRFGGTPDVLGRVISLNGTSVTIIGVMPPDFKWFIKENSLTGKPAELWRPMVFTEENRVQARALPVRRSRASRPASLPSRRRRKWIRSRAASKANTRTSTRGGA